MSERAPDPTPPQEWIASVRRDLLKWYGRHRRELPWRETSDPWSILVSEVMLQQTRVETVIPFYRRFLDRFPTPKDLAVADEHDVLALWAGLGYYRRARHLKRAAEQIAERHQGRFPDDPRDILALAGVGRYTAGAVASIAFEKREPVVDGNVARVLSRLRAIDGDLTTSRGARRLWAVADALVDPRRPGDFNQAIMELGALVCTPASPRCDACPVATRCAARSDDAIDRFPPPRRREQPVAVRLAAVLVSRSDGTIGVVRRREGTLMAGLLDVPSLELDEHTDAPSALREWMARRFGRDVRVMRPHGVVRHSITRHRLRVEVFVATDGARRRDSSCADAPATGGVEGAPDHHLAPCPDADGLQFVDATALADLGISNLARKVIARAQAPELRVNESRRKRGGSNG